MQSFLLDQVHYNYEEDRETAHSVVQVLKKRRAHCFEGAIFAAGMLWYHGRPPLLVLLEAFEDYDHNLAIYWEKGRVGSVAQSRHLELMGKPALFSSVRDLVLSYYPDYYSDWTESRDELTLRGFSQPIDLRKFGTGWVLGKDAWDLYWNYIRGVPLEMLFPQSEEDPYYFYPEEWIED